MPCCYFCRVSDTMLNVWMLMMFGSGIPFLYIIGLAWSIIQDLLDRHALVKLCRQPVRYGPRMPLLLIGEARFEGIM